jgi:CBS domain-containing protein
MHLKDVMSQPVVTCPVTSTLDVPARLMWEFDCGVIPLTDDEGRLGGIITDRDICIAALTQGKPLHEIPVAGAMAAYAAVCHAEETVEAAERLMKSAQVRRVPVVDGEGRPVGLVSLNDLARLAVHARRSGVDREFVQTMATICRPRPRAGAIDKVAALPAVAL